MRYAFEIETYEIHDANPYDNWGARISLVQIDSPSNTGRFESEELWETDMWPSEEAARRDAEGTLSERLGKLLGGL